MKKKAFAVVGLQFGSEAKGNIVGHLAYKHQPDTVIHNWSPNAGHTLITPAGRKLVHTMLPLGIVSDNLKRILIGPGAVINVASLSKEITQAADLIEGVQIIIHPHAAVVDDSSLEAEKAFNRIGSTQKGSAAAAMSRMERDPGNPAIALNRINPSHIPHSKLVIDKVAYDEAIAAAEVTIIEGCQGFGLSMYHGFYPYCTSRDTSVSQLFTDCAIPRKMQANITVVGVMRTFPIRVSNRYDEEGNMVGWSGPCYSDSEETTWEQVGQPTEYTTVTKLPRRIFTFSKHQIEEAIRMNGVDEVALTFCDYLDADGLVQFLKFLKERSGLDIDYLTFGPSVTHAVELGEADAAIVHSTMVEEPLNA